MATPQSRVARAKEMAERTDRQCPSAEQVPNESFWADQPGLHNLPSDVETEHWRLVVNHALHCSASVPVPIVNDDIHHTNFWQRQATATVFGS